jgi:hypothetical protein
MLPGVWCSPPGASGARARWSSSGGRRPERAPRKRGWITVPSASGSRTESKASSRGWTIAERPAGKGPLWIGLEFGGDLCLRIEDGARSGVLFDGSGEPRLRYGGLRAFDATQRELVARLLVREGGVGIQVDDTGATYPLTIDPLLTGPGPWRRPAT